jgi:hypothetical protein
MALPPLVAVGRFLADLIESERLAIVLVDPDGSQYPVLPDTAAQPDGFLPVFLEAAEAVWEDATGCGFGVLIGADQSSLLGFRAEGLADVPFSVVALTMLHAIEEARDGDVLRLNAMSMHAAQARSRARYSDSAPASSSAPSSTPQPGPSP